MMYPVKSSHESSEICKSRDDLFGGRGRGVNALQRNIIPVVNIVWQFREKVIYLKITVGRLTSFEVIHVDESMIYNQNKSK